MNATLHDLAGGTYSPLYSTAKDVVNMAALVGLNVLNGEYEQVMVSEVRELVESNAFIVDVREEFEQGHLINSVNIPLSQFGNDWMRFQRIEMFALSFRSKKL